MTMMMAIYGRGGGDVSQHRSTCSDGGVIMVLWLLIQGMSSSDDALY